MPSQLPSTLTSSENGRHSLYYGHVTQKSPGNLPPPHPVLSLGTTKAEAHLVFAFAFGNSEGFRRRRFTMRPHLFKQCSLGDQGLSPGGTI